MFSQRHIYVIHTNVDEPSVSYTYTRTYTSWVFTHPNHWNPLAIGCQGGWEHRILHHHHSNRSAVSSTSSWRSSWTKHVAWSQLRKSSWSWWMTVVMARRTTKHQWFSREWKINWQYSLLVIDALNKDGRFAQQNGLALPLLPHYHIHQIYKYFFVVRADRRRQIEVFHILAFCTPDARTDERPEKVSPHASLLSFHDLWFVHLDISSMISVPQTWWWLRRGLVLVCQSLLQDQKRQR